MAVKVTYPIGEQDFRSLRRDGCAYVDKTRYIAKILDDKNKYYFLARPRRFGKSLFLSTLRYFFEGERDLFKGLYIDTAEGVEWKRHPVLHLDLNNGEYSDPRNLDSVLNKNLRRWEERYGVDVKDDTFAQRFETIIETIHEKTGMQVVILVDEYDKPLLFATHADLRNSFNCIRSKKELLGLDLKSADPTALLYQTGFLTIKGYDPDYEEFTLGIPNREVEEGLMDVLLPYYVVREDITSGRLIGDLIQSVRKGEPQELMERLQAYFAGISYELQVHDENNFQNAFYILASLLELGAEAEVRTSDGRIDMVLKSREFIFVIELKYDRSAQETIDQINKKQYALRYATDRRRLFKIGVNFSSKTRRIEDWLIEE